MSFLKIKMVKLLNSYQKEYGSILKYSSILGQLAVQNYNFGFNKKK
jgi:hypothetical protein